MTRIIGATSAAMVMSGPNVTTSATSAENLDTGARRAKIILSTRLIKNWWNHFGTREMDSVTWS